MAVAALTVTGASATVTLARPGTIQISDAQVRHIHVDVGARGPSAGDLDVYALRSFNKRITPKPIGHAEILCRYTGEESSDCAGRYFLAKGEIVAGGVIASKLLFELAVYGGTGLYRNVRGTLTVRSLERRPATDLLVFRLTL